MIYAQVDSYTDGSGNPAQTVAARAEQPDTTWIPYDVPSADWLYLSAGDIIIHTQAEMDAIAQPILLVKLESDVQNYIDSKAKARGYDSANSCISYFNSSIAVWRSDAISMSTWRDAVWNFCYTNSASATPSTTWAALQPLLPAAPW